MVSENYLISFSLTNFGVSPRVMGSIIDDFVCRQLVGSKLPFFSI